MCRSMTAGRAVEWRVPLCRRGGEVEGRTFQEWFINEYMVCAAGHCVQYAITRRAASKARAAYRQCVSALPHTEPLTDTLATGHKRDAAAPRPEHGHPAGG